MNGLVSFNGIDIRRTGNELRCSCLLGRGNSFNRTIHIKSIKEIYFEMGTFKQVAEESRLVIKTVHPDRKSNVYNNFNIPSYLTVTEDEVDLFVNKIKHLIRG